jgi:hypothetical protein
MDELHQNEQQADSEGAAKGRPRGRPFSKGGDERQAHRLAAVKTDAASDLDEQQASPDLYRDMLHVYTKQAQEDRTQGQKDCRKWKAKDLKGFMAKLADLEKARAGRGGKAEDPSEPEDGYEPDEGDRRLEALLAKGIADGKEEQAQEDAKLASRPDAVKQGASLQAELKAALWRERLLLDEVAAWKRRGLSEEEQHKGMMNDMFVDWCIYQRLWHIELAVRPEPEKVIGSLQKAVEGTQGRERNERATLRELKGEAQA